MSAKASSQPELPRPAVLGVASGIFFLTFFGAFWGIASAIFLSGAVQIGAFVLVGIVTVAFFIVGIMLARYAGSLPNTVTPEEAATGRRIGMWFGIVFGAEFVLIALAAILLPTFGAGHFITPVIALIVGVHFFPLARLFSVRMYYLTGALLCLIALVAIVAILVGAQIAGSSPYNWSTFVGIGAALILWLTLVSLSSFAIRLMQRGA